MLFFRFIPMCSLTPGEHRNSRGQLLSLKQVFWLILRRLSASLIHEYQFFKERYVLLILQQRAHQRGHRDFVVFGLQHLSRNVFGHQQFDPIEQLGSGWLFLDARQVAHIVKRLHRCAEQLFLEGWEMHVHDLLHGLRFWEFDVVEKAAAQKSIGQLFFVVGGDEDQGACFGFDQLAGLVAIKLHAINFAQQIVGEFDVGFVDFVNEQRYGLLRGKGLPEHAFDDVVVNVLHAFAAIQI
jgi:hypothetical protein